MKKTRILSMLLAVVLALSSLPVMTVSVAADELAAMERGDSIALPTGSATNWTGTTYVNDDYIAVALRGSAGFTPLAIYDPADANSPCDDNVNYKVYYTFRKNDYRVANESLGLSYNNNALKLEFLVVGLNSSGGADLGKKVKTQTSVLGDEWTTISTTFKIPANADGKYGLYIMAQGSSSNFVEWDIKGIKVVEAANENNVVFTFGSFSDPENPNWTLLPAASTYAVKRNDLMKKSWLSADLAGTGASYDVEDTKLLPGVYQLIANVNTDADEIDLGVKLGDTVMTAGATAETTAAVGDTATEYVYTVTIDEETTLSKINFEWTKASESTATELIINSAKFKCVELTTATNNSSIKGGTLVAAGDSIAFWSSDTGAVEVDDSRNYVQCHVRGGGYGLAPITIYDPDTPDDNACELDVTYKFTIKIRQNENCQYKTKKMAVSVSQNGSGTTTSPLVNFGKSYLIDDEWMEITGTFTLPSTGDKAVTTKRIFKMFPECKFEEWVDWDLRGIKIERVSDGEVVAARGEYDEKLTPAEWSFPPYANSGKQESYTDFSELMLTPDATNGSTFTYDATSKNITLAPGQYTVSASVYAADGTQTVKLTAKAANGESDTGTAYGVGANLTTVKITLEITETTKLSEVGLIVDGGSDIYLNEIKITEKGPEFVAPNVGIMMAMLLKKAGPYKNFTRTNLLEKAVEHVGSEMWTYPETDTLTTGQEGEQTFISIKNIAKNYDNFTYKPGFELLPGTYELTGAVRTANKGQTTSLRAFVGGTKVGRLSATNAWSRFTITFEVEDIVDFKFAISGESWAECNKDFDLASLVLVRLDETPDEPYVLPWSEVPVDPDEEDSTETVPTEHESDAEVVLSAVEGSLIPDVYNDVGGDKWDLGLAKYEQTLSVKSKDGNLYLAMRNIAKRNDEGTGFTYNTGITLEPGTYVLECDARTAFTTEKAMVRTFVNGAPVNLKWVNDQWTSIDGEFEIIEATELVIVFRGGADASYMKDFDVTNIKVIKK